MWQRVLQPWIIPKSGPVVTARRHARILLEKTKKCLYESELDDLKDKSEINIIERVPEHARAGLVKKTEGPTPTIGDVTSASLTYGNVYGNVNINAQTYC